MAKFKVSRTLVKSPPELWPDITGARLTEAIGGAELEVAEEEQMVRWEAQGARGTASLEPSGWGTKVTLRGEIEEQVAERGLWSRLRGGGPGPRPGHLGDLERRLEGLLDDLGSDHRKPFVRD